MTWPCHALHFIGTGASAKATLTMRLLREKVAYLV